MPDIMTFPTHWGDFVKDYSFCDSEEIYTNGIMLIPTFRISQMVDHYFNTPREETCSMRPVNNYPVDDIAVPCIPRL